MAHDHAGSQNDEGRSAPLSVTDAMALAKHSLESLVVRIVGEVSEVSIKPGYKAAYFTVKDSGAALPCMMWNNRYRAAGIDLAVGQLVEISGRFTLYAVKGRMNFDVFSVSLAGEGDLRMKVATIAKKLAAEGLTDQARKRRLPRLPERIGLVTSPRSAAVHDVLRTLRRRYPVAEVLLAGVPVEGSQAPAYIADGLRCVVSAGAEVVLIVRGGGSLEDLMPFNDEALARAIAACPVPVVTGIGHEVDTSIADMVSDFRASTPTAAAEAISPSPESLHTYFESRRSSLDSAARLSVERLRMRVQRIADRPVLCDPLLLFASDAQAIDSASERLSRALPARIEREIALMGNYRDRVLRIGPAMTERFGYEIGAKASRLEDLSPLNTLARGYSIVRDSEGGIARSVDEIDVGSVVDVSLSDGTLACKVESKQRRG